jgi:type IV secretory pathway TrbD component
MTGTPPFSATSDDGVAAAEGWRAPLAQSLAEPVLLAGLPRGYAVVMGTTALVLGLALRLWWLGLFWWAVAHAVGLWAARTDKRFFEVLRRHLALPGHLDA